MGKVVPVPAPKNFLNRTGTKMFFLGRDRDQNIFDWDRHRNLFLKGPRPRNFFSSGPAPKMTGPAHA